MLIVAVCILIFWLSSTPLSLSHILVPCPLTDPCVSRHPQQRLTGGGQESQASPNYSSAMGMSPLGQMPSPGQRPCPSPHSPSLGGQAGFPGYGAGGQVSPRAAPAPASAPQPGGGPSPSPAQLPPGGPPPGTPGAAQARAAAVAAAAGKLQQQNPELNAQLSVSGRVT